NRRIRWTNPISFFKKELKLCEIQCSQCCCTQQGSPNDETGNMLSAPPTPKEKQNQNLTACVLAPSCGTSNFPLLFLQVHVGGEDYIHLIIFRGLPCNGGKVSLTNVKDHQTKISPLQPF
uniref:Uncharacterized protein n=1 Tax=Sander lucioperca TaxID=283035 RepID=A0A8D0A879_SANLU